MKSGHRFVLAASILMVFGCGRKEEIRKKQADDSIIAGQAYASNGNWPEAMALFQSAVTLAPSYPKAYLELGKAQEASGEVEQALASYGKILELETADPSSGISDIIKFTGHSRLAALNLKLKRWDEVVQHSRDGMKFQQPGSTLHIPLATALFETGKKAEAGAALDEGEAILKGVPDTEYFVALALLRSKLGDQDKAFKTLQQGLELYPDSGDIRFGYGIMLLGKNDAAGATDQLKYLSGEANSGYYRVLSERLQANAAKVKPKTGLNKM